MDVSQLGSDPLSKLIKRAEVFRDALAKASGDASSQYQPRYGRSSYLSKKSIGNPVLQEASEDVSLVENAAAETFSDISLLENLFENENSPNSHHFEFESEEEDLKLFDMEFLKTEQEHPRDVAEEALLQELFFPGSEEVRLPSICENPLEGVDETLCALTLSESPFQTSLPSQSSICLTVNVGKLLFCQPVKGLNVTLAEFSSSPAESTCLLTLIFPSIASESKAVGCCPEQRISIMPIKFNKDELLFEHQSQLFWKLPQEQLICSVWRSQMMKGIIEVRVQEGETLQGSAYLSLHNVVKLMPSTFQTNMVLVGSENSVPNCFQNYTTVLSECNKPDQPKGVQTNRKLRMKESCLRQKWNGHKPFAIVEIGLKLSHCSQEDCFPIQKFYPQTEEHWLYVYLQDLAHITKFDTVAGKSTSLMLVIKSGGHSIFRLVSVADSTVKVNPDAKILVQNLADALVKAPEGTKKAIVFIEIWCNHKGALRWRSNGLENLCGLLKVHLFAHGVQKKVDGAYKIAADGTFSLWHPQSDSEVRKVKATIFMGSKAEMMRVQEENRSAVVIQGHMRKHLKRCLQSRRKLSGNNQQLSESGETLRHVFEVTVQRAKDIPVEELLESQKGNILRGIFIKYIFPGEDEPLFTHEVELWQTMVFGATVHHRITLSQGQQLFDYLQDLDEETSGLRFELWSHAFESQNQGHQSLCKNADHMIPKKQENVISSSSGEDSLEFSEFSVKRKEKCIGMATLPMKELLGLVSLTLQQHSSLKVRRLFNLPIKLQKWTNIRPISPKLNVQVAYDVVELADKHLLEGTIFHNYSIPGTEIQFPMKASLEVLIMEIQVPTVMHYASPASVSTRVTPHMRFSLFPCNRELQLNYPPIITPLTGDSQYVKYTLKIRLDALVIKELWESYMSFEVWNCSSLPHEEYPAIENGSVQEDSWIGIATVPCVMLISRKQGITGWIGLLGRDQESVGSLKVSISFVDWECISPR